MKLNIRQLVLAFVLLFAVSIHPKQLSAQPDEINFQIFYDALSPYGQWVDYENYGYVWIPDVGSDFAPYSTDGYWVLTDFGWTWVSDYEWGWAPFHYGRWDYDKYYGWLWVPDSEWGPSWVNWRRADGYYGWSPMQPGISITLGFNSPYNRNHDYWMFVSDRDFEQHDLYRYAVDRSRHEILVRNSTIINKVFIDNSRHTTYVTGPSRDDVQKATGRWISPVAIMDHEKPGRDLNDGSLGMYRPQVTRDSELSHKPVPERVEELNNVKRPSERSRSAQSPPTNQRNNNFISSIQQRDTSPLDNSERQKQQNDARQQDNNRTQPVQQQQSVAANSNERQQQNDARQQTNQQTPPVKQPQQQQTAPANNNYKQPQQQQTAPANNNYKQSQQQQTAPANNNYKQHQQQQQQTAPANSGERQKQQNDARQQNNYRTQSGQQPQQQQTAPANNNYKQHQQQQQQQENARQQQQINTRKQSAPQQVAPAADNQKE